MGAHARLSPSNKRWPHCPGSIREEAVYPDISGEAAIDGTGSHELLELCLKNGVRAETYDSQIVAINHPDNPMGWMVSIDRINRVQQGLDYVQRRVKELSDEFKGCTVTVYSESKSNPGEKVERDDWWGTVDITIEVVSPFDKIVFLEVIDYKDGRGWVDVKNNSQLVGYTAGKIDLNAHLTPYRMTIVQPKTNPSVRYEEGTVGSLRAEFNILVMAAELTDDPDAPLVSGKHCTWCKHGRAKNCTTMSEKSLKEVKSMFPVDDNIKEAEGKMLFETIGHTFGDITQLPSAKLEELADAREGIMAVFDRVNEELQRRIEDPADNTVTGHAMLPGRGSQAWAEDEEAIVKMLKARRMKKDDIYPAKLITPAALLKVACLTDDQKEKIEKKYIEKKAGKLTLKKVRTSEPADAKMMFADVPAIQPTSFM